MEATPDNWGQKHMSRQAMVPRGEPTTINLLMGLSIRSSPMDFLLHS